MIKKYILSIIYVILVVFIIAAFDMLLYVLFDVDLVYPLSESELIKNYVIAIVILFLIRYFYSLLLKKNKINVNSLNAWTLFVMGLYLLVRNTIGYLFSSVNISEICITFGSIVIGGIKLILIHQRKNSN